jgi:hypothetical protein
MLTRNKRIFFSRKKLPEKSELNSGSFFQKKKSEKEKGKKSGKKDAQGSDHSFFYPLFIFGKISPLPRKESLEVFFHIS